MKVAITAFSEICALGHEHQAINEAYAGGRTGLRWLDEAGVWAAPLPDATERVLQQWLADHDTYRELDRSTQLALFAAEALRQQVATDNWSQVGVQMGSSRGATHHWEACHGEFLATGRVPVKTSPLTTLGNLGSWVGQHLGSRGWQASHSITCSTGLHALAQGYAWLRAGLADRFVVGGAEAPLTPFTFQQMRALRILPPADPSLEQPCAPFSGSRTSGMVLGEGAACFLLEKLPPSDPDSSWQPAPGATYGRLSTSASRLPIFILGLGYAQEPLTTATGIDPAGRGLEQAMRMALGDYSPAAIDCVIAHAPGTRLGDAAEGSALRSVFGKRLPVAISNKALTGHALGAAGAFSLALAVRILTDGLRPPLAQLEEIQAWSGSVRKVLVNATGFGGNTVSVLLGQ